ncbi:MAG: NADH-quinone oxidoreductase subunit C [Actinobacteria bacterium]|nr:NADH-quinone oxidoreductase subunit C [Actinomycetota bacterium]
MPDAVGLELIAGELRAEFGDDAVVGTSYHREQACVQVDPSKVIRVLGHLRARAEHPYPFLASLHGCDYLPEAPRLGIHYELLNMRTVDRLRVKVRLDVDYPQIESCVELFPSAEFQEREVFDMFGVVFTGHPDLRRILMPEDYEGYPQRRDFPLGGELVIFTHNEPASPGWYR